MRPRRSTATLTLVLVGAAALQGCGGEDEKATRDVYRTRADCQRDWGDDAKKCEQQTSGPHSGFFYGPLMYGMGRMAGGSGLTSQSAMAPRKGNNAIGSTTVTRGGFGSSASAHSSGG
jgi:uncharacterized protein YgiB involved in biofilm formation